jgi:hypothetical protein
VKLWIFFIVTGGSVNSEGKNEKIWMVIIGIGMDLGRSIEAAGMSQHSPTIQNYQP